MATSERTYSFRASADLGMRVRDAAELLAGFLADPNGGDATLERIVEHFALAVYRDPTPFLEARENQSAFMRRAIELFVDATEKVAADRRYADEYAKVAADLTDDERAAAAAMRAAAARRLRDT